MGAPEHRNEAPARLRFAVLTVSDTRTPENDEGGDMIVDLCLAQFHEVTVRELRRDEPEDVAAWVRTAVAHDDVDVVVITGGTGFSRRDSTHEALAAMYEPAIPGFGELFRMLSFAEVGGAAMLSRASAGIVGGTAVFSLPGSPSAVRLAMTRLVLPEAGHLVAQLQG